MVSLPSYLGYGDRTPQPALYEIGETWSSTHFLYDSIHGRQLLLPRFNRSTAEALKIFIPSPMVRIASGLLQFPCSRKTAMLNARLLEDSGLAWICLNRLVVYIGSPGPYSKYTLLYLDERGHPESIIKLALTPEASSLVANEISVLRELSTMTGLNGHVPAVMASFQSNAVSWIQQRIQIGKGWAGRDIGLALDFLRLMGKETEEYCSFVNSNFFLKLTTRLEKIRDNLSEGWHARSDDVIYTLIKNAPESIRFVRAHRDFTKWNMRNASEKPFIFDWEYSERCYPDAYDFLHYLLMPLALRGRVNGKVLAESARVVRYYRESAGREFRNLCWQQMAYLFDVCLFYLESNKGASDSDVVVENYGRILDSMLHAVSVQ